MQSVDGNQIVNSGSLHEWNIFKSNLGSNQAKIFNLKIRAGRDFQNWDFKNTNFDNCTFENCVFHGANFSGASLTTVRFLSCKLSSSIFQRSQHDEAKGRPSKLREVEIIDSNLSGAIFEGSEIHNSAIVMDKGECVLDHASFIECSIIDTRFHSRSANNTRFTGSSICSSDKKAISLQGQNISFSSGAANKTKITDVALNVQGLSPEFQNSEIVRCSFSSNPDRRSNFKNARLLECQFAESGKWLNSDFSNSMLRDVKLSHCDFSVSSFNNTQIIGGTIESTNFSQSTFDGAKIENVIANDRTNFSQLKSVKAFSLDAYSFHCLGDNRGNLTVGQLMDMNIINDADALIIDFTGIKKFMAQASVVIFLAPYLLFILEAKLTRSVASKVGYEISSSDPSIFWGTISRGTNSASPFPLFLTILFFLYFAVFNTVRWILLWKAADLEARKSVTGIPPRFSFSELARLSFLERIGTWLNSKLIMAIASFLSVSWGTLRRFVSISIGVAIALALVQTVLLLSERYPERESVFDFLLHQKFHLMPNHDE